MLHCDTSRLARISSLSKIVRSERDHIVRALEYRASTHAQLIREYKTDTGMALDYPPSSDESRQHMIDGHRRLAKQLLDTAHALKYGTLDYVPDDWPGMSSDDILTVYEYPNGGVRRDY